MLTRIQGDQRSCLDYVLVSDNLKKWISSVFIDEEGELDLYSDHVIVRTVFKPRVYIKSNVSRPDFIWKVNDSTDWEIFKSSLQLEFDDLSFINDNKGNVDSIWELWKSKVNRVAEKTIGRTKRVKNFRFLSKTQGDGPECYPPEGNIN